MSKTIKNILYVSVAVVIGKIITVFTTFSLARFFLPEEYGIYTTCLMFISLSSIFCLGTVETLVKKLPFYIGKEEFDKARQLESDVLGSVMIASFFLLMIGFSTVYFIHLPINFIVYRSCVILTIFASAVSLLSSFYYFSLTAFQNFKMVSLIDTARSLLTGKCSIL